MTAGKLHVHLLGGARVRVGSSHIVFLPEKRYQLLAYLAYANDWVSRERLLYLFWPDAETEKAQQNLRQLLRRVRRFEWLTNLEANEYQLRWQLETDVALFRKALEEDRLDEALSFYSGPLLAGMETDEAPEFSSWLELESSHLQELWRDALMRRVQSLGERPAEAAKLLKVLLEADPLDEEALLAYMQAASEAGQRQRALAAYQNFAHFLEDDLGLEPSTTTQRLAEALEQSEANFDIRPSIPPVSSPRSFVLPAPTTSFVGRNLELAKIAHLLAKPDCRLLSIIGPGGIGKTRLALRTAEELGGHYPDGVYFVPLDALSSEGAIPSGIALALGLTLQAQEEPLTQIIQYLEKKQVLLVLDNFEHLLEGATLASHLVQGCSKLKLLTTSRERLGQAEEWLLSVEGLPLPEGGKSGPSDAVTLFTQRAQQVLPTFTVTAESLPHITAICQLVQGSPLGIELSAVWVRLMSPSDIAREIEANLDLLSTSARNVPERQRSIRATFDYSWKLLTPVEQEALRKLSVFHGGFTKEAAAMVAGVPIAVLAALLDKSLLRVSAAGRYDQHPLLYQYGQEKLVEQPEEQADVQARHAAYFSALGKRLDLEFHGAEPGQAYERLEAELENFRAAWRWAVENKHLRTLDACATSLGGYVFDRWQKDESIKLWTSALAALDETNPAHQATVGGLMGHLSYGYAQRGRLDEAERFAEQGLALLRPLRDTLEDTSGMFICFIALANVAQGRGRLQQMIAILQEQEALGLVRFQGRHLNNLGIIEMELGNYAAAQSYFQRALEHNRKDNFMSERIKSLNVLSEAYILAGNLEAAKRYAQEAVTLVHRHGPTGDFDDYSLLQLGRVLLEQGEFKEAEVIARQLLEKHPQPDGFRGEALELLGRVATFTGDYTQAEHYFRQFIKETLEHSSGFTSFVDFGSVLLHVCELRLRQGRYQEAAAVLGFLSPRLHYAPDKDFCERLLSEVRAVMQPQALEETLTKGAASELEEVVESVLQRL